jgi:hypothetical protein
VIFLNATFEIREDVPVLTIVGCVIGFFLTVTRAISETVGKRSFSNMPGVRASPGVSSLDNAV